MESDFDQLKCQCSAGRRIFARAVAPVRRAAWLIVLFASVTLSVHGATNDAAAAPGWLTQPLSLVEAIRIALAQNADIVRALHDVEAAHGVAIQVRAIVLPTLRGSAEYEHNEAVEESIPGKGFLVSSNTPEDQWRGSVRVLQSVYEGGRLLSAWRTGRLTREQALLDYQATVADTLLNVRTAYYDVLLAQQQIVVRDASVKLLEQELANTKRRFDAGAVPRFDVLRGEVEVANARPKLIRAKNSYRNAKSQLGTLLGYNIPTNIWEDIPLVLTTKLETGPYSVELPRALMEARERRPELGALRRAVSLQEEKIIVAKAGYKPSLGVFGGYNSHSSEFRDHFYDDVSGPLAGVALSWNIFDGARTRGRVMEARALAEKAEVALADRTRRVEQEVRTAYSSFVEAREVLESQKLVVEQADEAIRLAGSRYEAGSGTQLDVLNAQTALTEARTTQVEAARDYLVARARVERAIGADTRQEEINPPLKERPKP